MASRVLSGLGKLVTGVALVFLGGLLVANAASRPSQPQHSTVANTNTAVDRGSGISAPAHHLFPTGATMKARQ